jgi:hypothetical protein
MMDVVLRAHSITYELVAIVIRVNAFPPQKGIKQ